MNIQKKTELRCGWCNKKVFLKDKTKRDLAFCNYECMENYYGDEIPEDEDFIDK